MAICPSYYRRGNVEVWDFIRDQGLSYHLGNAVKYICRAGYKDSAIEDLTKAIHYLQNELEHVITEQSSHRVRRAYNIPNDLSRRKMQKDLIVEEFKEFIEANHDMALMDINSRADCLKELADLVSSVLSMLRTWTGT